MDNAHNVFLGWLVNCGALGLAAYLALLVCCAVTLIRRKGQFWKALLLSLLCAAVHSFFGLGLCLTEPIFYALLGLAAAGVDSVDAKAPPHRRRR